MAGKKVFIFAPTQDYSGGALLIPARNLDKAKLAASTRGVSLKYLGTLKELRKEILDSDQEKDLLFFE